jgi:hypothetical protein
LHWILSRAETPGACHRADSLTHEYRFSGS